MNLLIIIDNDGHAHALERNVVNLRKIIHYLDDVGMVEPTVPKWVKDPDVGVERLEEFMLYHCPMDRAGGGQLYFVESEAEFKQHNPFQ